MSALRAKAALFGILLLAWPLPAAAQPPPSPTSATSTADLKRLGDDAMDAGRYAEALAFYERAYAESKDPAISYNRSRIYQKMGDWPLALEALERFVGEASPELRARVPRLDALLIDLRGKVTTLDVRCNVEGARVVITDRVVGTTPLLKTVRIPSGHAVIEATADGYFPFRREVDAIGAQTLVIEVTLTSKAISGILSITSSVAAAEVVLDGQTRGNAPLEAAVKPGMHRIQVSRSGYEPFETQIVVQAGERREVPVPLQKEPALTSRWYFWTTVGAVVVGGGVLTYALLKTKSVEPGSISPGVVSSGLVRF